jgi:plastocyanin
LLPLAFGAAAWAGTVTAHVAYNPPAGRGKASAGSQIVLWLTPLSSTVADQALPALHELPNHFQLTQSHKRFDPRLLVIPVGSVVDFPNKDPFFHNVFSLFDGKRFDLGLYEGGTTHAVKFDRAGVSFIFCNIHPEMSAVILTMKTPYYAVSNKTGEVEIQNVPAGRYRLEIWSERALPDTLRSLEREVAVAEGTSSLGTILLHESQDLLAGHKNKYGRDYEPTGPSTPAYRQPE